MEERVAEEGMMDRVRPLTRGELQELRKLAMHPSGLKALGDAAADRAVDVVLGMVVGEEAVKAMPNPDAVKLFNAVIAATYPPMEEKKPLETPSEPSEPEGGTNA